MIKKILFEGTDDHSICNYNLKPSTFVDDNDTQKRENGPNPLARKRRSFVCQIEIPMGNPNLVASREKGSAKRSRPKNNSTERQRGRRGTRAMRTRAAARATRVSAKRPRPFEQKTGKETDASD